MNCPLCNVALKAVGHRGVEVNYCPLCGGTWLDRWGYDNLSRDTPARHLRHRWLCVAVLTALLLVGCLVAVVSVGAVKLWATVQSWTEAFLIRKDTALISQVRDLAGRVADPRILELRRSGLTSAEISALIGSSGFERLLNSVAAAPKLAPLVQDGAYFKALQEAARQKIPNLAELRPDQILAPDVRMAAEQVQEALQQAPGVGRIAGTVDASVLELLGSNTFQQISRSGVLDRLFGTANRGAAVE